jgi:heptaprenylglyceryl phosphate synthase
MKTLIFQFSKRGLVLTFLTAILLIPIPLVYAEWTSISPPYVSSNWALSSVHFTSSSEGWAVGGGITQVEFCSVI